MPATRLDIIAERGLTLRVTADVLAADGVTPDTDLTGWTGQMQIRAAQSATATLLATGTVTVDTATGVVTAEVDDAVTADFTWRSAWYDLWIEDSTDSDGLLYGIVRVRPTTV